MCGPVKCTICMSAAAAAAIAEYWKSQRTRILVTDERLRMSIRDSFQQRRNLLNYNLLCLILVYTSNII